MGLTYKESGVDVDAGNELVKRITPIVQKTHHADMLSGIGGFAGLANIPSRFNDPVLVFSTDGAGTKLKLATQYDRHEHIGQDLVAMCVNDILVSGAEPFVFLDYFATGKLELDIAERVIRGIAQACKLAGCALGGGETAEMPGFYAHAEYDLAGFAVGLIERAEIRQPDDVSSGDVLVGLASNGPHANGYSLIRTLLECQSPPPGSILSQLLAPTEIYVEPVLSVKDLVKGMVHITGGGFKDNLPRSFDPSLEAHIDPNSWDVPSCFDWIRSNGEISSFEMFSTFNCGIGMILITSKKDVQTLLKNLESKTFSSYEIGSIVTANTQPEPGTLVVGHGGMRFI